MSSVSTTITFGRWTGGTYCWGLGDSGTRFRGLGGEAFVLDPATVQDQPAGGIVDRGMPAVEAFDECRGINGLAGMFGLTLATVDGSLNVH